LSSAVTLAGAYDGGRASPVGPQDHVIHDLLQWAVGVQKQWCTLMCGRHRLRRDVSS